MRIGRNFNWCVRCICIKVGHVSMGMRPPFDTDMSSMGRRRWCRRDRCELVDILIDEELKSADSMP